MQLLADYLDDMAAKVCPEMSSRRSWVNCHACRSHQGFGLKRLITEAGKAVGQSRTQIESDELDSAFRRAQVSFAGMAVGVPSSHLN